VNLNTDAPAMASISMLKIGRTYQEEVRRVLQGSKKPPVKQEAAMQKRIRSPCLVLVDEAQQLRHVVQHWPP